MPVHALHELRLPGCDEVLKALPGFDLYSLRHVRRLCLLAEQPGGHSFDLELAATYEGGEEKDLLVFTFSGVRMVKMPELTPSFFLAEFEVEDVSADQLEGIRYRARCYETPSFEVLCGGIAVRLSRS